MNDFFKLLIMIGLGGFLIVIGFIVIKGIIYKTIALKGYVPVKAVYDHEDKVPYRSKKSLWSQNIVGGTFLYYVYYRYVVKGETIVSCDEKGYEEGEFASLPHETYIYYNPYNPEIFTMKTTVDVFEFWSNLITGLVLLAIGIVFIIIAIYAYVNR